MALRDEMRMAWQQGIGMIKYERVNQYTSSEVRTNEANQPIE